MPSLIDPNGVVQIRQTASASVAPLADVGLREFLVKDGKTLLRLSLPTSLPTSTKPGELGDVGREVQEAVELVRLRLEQVGFSGKTTIWNACLKEVNTAKALVVKKPDRFLAGIPSEKLELAKDKLSQIVDNVGLLEEAVRSQDIAGTLRYQDDLSRLVYETRLMSMPPDTLPYSIPDEYKGMPVLKGMAKAECILTKARGEYDLGNGKRSNQVTLIMELDGYRAPLTTGNFVDLVQRKFFNELPIQSADDLIVQTGKPPAGGADNAIDGFVDPKTREKRTVPLELFYKSDVSPTYEYTSDEDLRATESMADPFQAYGAIGMAHDPENPNTASSQFWMLKWDQALVPPSRNTLDGSQACLGYITSNEQILGQVEKGDQVTSIRILEGLDNFHAEYEANL